jgi:hypothetical protein
MNRRRGHAPGRDVIAHLTVELAQRLGERPERRDYEQRGLGDDELAGRDGCNATQRVADCRVAERLELTRAASQCGGRLGPGLGQLGLRTEIHLGPVACNTARQGHQLLQAARQARNIKSGYYVSIYVRHAGLRSFASDGRLRCHRSAIPRGRVGPHRGTMFPNSGGEGRTPPAGAFYVNYLISTDSRCISADPRHHVP